MIGLIGTFVNAAAVIAGGTLGLILNSRFPRRLSDSVMKALGLCTIFIGITGIMKGENQLVTIVSMALGTLLGELLNLDDRLNKLGLFLQRKFKGKNAKVSIAEGFVNASLLFCVGAMAIIGSLRSGLSADNQMIYTKSLLDFTSSVIFASTLGLGVLFAAIPIFLYQGTIVLLAHLLAPYLTDAVIAEMTCVGSILIMALGFNMLGITKLKVMNFVPAIFIPILLYLFI